MLAGNAANLSNQLTALVEDCFACSIACEAVVEACSASGLTDTFRHCELLSLDCADICRATAQVASRYAGGDPSALGPLLRACARACAECAEECGAHRLDAADRCAQASLRCKQACERLAGALRWR